MIVNDNSLIVQRHQYIDFEKISEIKKSPLKQTLKNKVINILNLFYRKSDQRVNRYSNDTQTALKRF